MKLIIYTLEDINIFCLYIEYPQWTTEKNKDIKSKMLN
jgi:hypothetical protein